MGSTAPAASARSEYVQARLDAILSRASTAAPSPLRSDVPPTGPAGRHDGTHTGAGSATVLAARRRRPAPLLAEALGRPRRGRAPDAATAPALPHAPAAPAPPDRSPLSTCSTPPDPVPPFARPPEAAAQPVPAPSVPPAGFAPVLLDDGAGSPASGPARPNDRAVTLQVPQLTRRHLVVLAAVLALAVAFSAFLLLRARADPQPVVLATETSAAPVPAPGPTPAATPEVEVVVHVLGAVREPGVVSLPQGARVGEAIAAAGGLTGEARPGELNLAQVLVDGQQVVVSDDDQPSEVRTGGDGAGGPDGGGGVGGGTAAEPGGALLDLNTATAAQLEELPGVGPVTAQKILDWRTEHGRFSRVEELQEVSGIGPKSYAEIAPHVRV